MSLKCGVISGIIKSVEGRYQHPSTHTGNLMRAGCGDVILPRFAFPASMSHGGFLMRKKRRTTRLPERLIPCQCCGHPVSQRHHLIPVARYGDTDSSVHLCANCHEAYHIFEQAWIDQRADRQHTRAIHLMSAIWNAWGGRDDPRMAYIIKLMERSDAWLQRDAQREDMFMWMIAILGDDISEALTKEAVGVIRRGDTVRLSDGRTARVVSVKGGYIFTTVGTYDAAQVRKVAKL